MCTLGTRLIRRLSTPLEVNSSANKFHKLKLFIQNRFYTFLFRTFFSQQPTVVLLTTLLNSSKSDLQTTDKRWQSRLTVEFNLFLPLHQAHSANSSTTKVFWIVFAVSITKKHFNQRFSLKCVNRTKNAKTLSFYIPSVVFENLPGIWILKWTIQTPFSI